MLDSIDENHNVGVVLLDRPFRIGRLGHFGINAIKMEEALQFDHALPGFKTVEMRDQYSEARI